MIIQLCGFQLPHLNYYMDDEIYFEEVGAYYHRGILPSLEDKLFLMINERNSFEKNLIYSVRLFEAHIKIINSVDYLDDITSSVARCVEYGLKPQMEILLANLDRLLSMATYDDGVTILDKRLLLRKINFECYVLASKFGFTDPELESRITLAQRILRKGQVQPVIYKGPTPEEFFKAKSSIEDLNNVINYRTSRRYWGYRHTLYYLKWNQSRRLGIAKLIKDFWWGDCRYQAYVDYLESGDDESMNFKPKHYI